MLAATTLAVLGAPAVSAEPLVPNPWLERRVLNMAHQGGEIEAPSDTLFAMKTAIHKGADVLELDVHATADREIVVLHDATVNRTTNGGGRVDELTLAQIRALDAAHWFVPGCGTCHGRPAKEYRYRGMATGRRSIPPRMFAFGIRKTDFRIPTLREVFQAFPNVPINIEIKNSVPDTEGYESLLARLIRNHGRTEDVIVVSFLDHAIEQFKVHAPEVPTATATVETALFYATAFRALPGAPNPRYIALQVPMVFEGIPVLSADFIANAHANGLAVHAWTINDRPTMEQLIDWGIDGIMTDVPTLLERVLTERGVRYVP
ncbi:MAG: glycerophosphodiester phosphodiesterase [Actinomycetota bacterium]